MDNNSFEILVPLNNTDTTNTNTTNTSTEAPFKRVHVVGKSNPHLTTNKDKHIKIENPVKGSFRYTSLYIRSVEKYLNKKFNQVHTEKTIEPIEVFNHLKSLNLFEGNVKSLSDHEDTVIGKLINTKVNQHNTKAKTH